MIAAIVLFSIVGTTLLWIIVSGVTDNGHWFIGPGLIMSGILSFIGTAILCTTPTNNDVREGEAHYVEQNHIEVINGDTINNYKIYKIEWNQN